MSAQRRDDAARRDRAELLFEQARELPKDAREAFLRAACGDDVELLRELGSLLAHASAGENLFDQLTAAVTPPALDDLTIGRYRLLACIGVGGMGAVFRAHDTKLHRDVALKFLPMHVRAGDDAEERLLAEARAAAALQHPNVCTVHDIGHTDDGRPYIAMAFYEGETLKERLQRGRVAPAEALDIAVQVARGLEAAHTLGIIHRDVKPGNILRTPDGTVKLLDFGLARFTNASDAATKGMPGTAGYMAPELFRGGEADERSDLWSLGVVLYELLTGTHPFALQPRTLLAETIQRATPPAIRTRAPDVPPEVIRVVERLLERDPQRRYATASDVIADLQEIAMTPSAPRGRFASTLTRTAAAALAGTSLVLVLAAVLPAREWGTALATAARPATVSAPATVVPARTVAVLPFTNHGADLEEDYFSDGLAEELIGRLSQVSSLRVAARTSAWAFKGEDRDIREIGATLDVGAVLEGSVRRDGDHLRIAAQLISVDDGLLLWSGTFERELTDVFAIQRELAASIVDALSAELTAAERARLVRQGTHSTEAFALYLKGRHFANQRTPAGAVRAIDYFERAIAADSLYAAPHAGLAGVFLRQGMAGAMDRAVARERTHAAVQRALQLDPESGEAHAMHGAWLHVFEWRPDTAEAVLRHAVELDPGSTTARHLYGLLLGATGRLDEAVEQKAHAVALDPLAPALSETLAFALLAAARTDEALRHVRNAIELDSTFWRAHSVLGTIQEVAGRPEEAIRAYARANELARGRLHRTRPDIARVLANTGRAAEARALLAEVLAEAEATGRHEPIVATTLAALGDVDGAFAWLEQSCDELHPLLPFLWGDPRYAALEDDPRFAAVMLRAGVRVR